MDTAPESIRCRSIILGMVALGASSLAIGQTTITPGISLAETYSDNAFLSLDSAARKSWISDVGATLGVVHQAAFSRLSIDYRLQHLMYSGIGERNNTQRFLNSSLHQELIDDHVYVDARGTITRQNRSAFDAVLPADTRDASLDRVETRTYSISPYAKGRFGDLAVFQARVNALETRAAGSNQPSSRSVEPSAGVRSDPAKGGLGWLVEGQGQEIDGDALDRRKSVRARAGLTFSASNQLVLQFFGGREKSDLAGGEETTSTIRGVGIQWQPGERTQVALAGGKRFFGNEYAMVFAHRMPLSAIRVSATRDVTFLATQAEAASTSPLISMLTDLLAASIPDPAARAATVQRRFEDSGLTPFTATTGASPTSRPVLNQRFDATFLVLGLRNTISLNAGGRRQSGIDGAGSAPVAAIENIRQRNAGATWTYRLDPISTLTYLFTYLQTEGLDSDTRHTIQRQHSLTINTRLSPQTTGTMGVRRIEIDSTMIPSYTENAVYCTINKRF